MSRTLSKKDARMALVWGVVSIATGFIAAIQGAILLPDLAISAGLLMIILSLKDAL